MSDHLAAVDLILLAASPAGPAGQGTGPGPRLAALRARIVPAADSPHLEEMAFAELIELTDEQAVDDAAISHLAGCTRCRADLEALAALARDPAVRRAIGEADAPAAPRLRSSSRARPNRIVLGALAAAAALLVAVRLVPSRPDNGGDDARLRHATITTTAAPRLIAPLGAVARADTLRWTSVPHADRYRVAVFDASGEVVWEAESADTVAILPGGTVTLAPGDHRWRVLARTSFDRWVESDFGEFTLAGEP